MKRHVTITAAVGIAAVAALAACSSQPAATPSGEANGGTFRVAMIVGQTGPLAATAADFQLGMQTAADLVNKEGGIKGKKIVIDVIDDKSDPTQAVTKLQGLINSGEEQPDLIYAGITSSETLAMLPILTPAKLLSMSQTTNVQINDPAQYPYHFGISPTNEDTLKVVANEFKEKGYKKIGMLVPGDANGDDLVKTLTNYAKKSGAEISGVEKYDANGVDYTVQYQRVLNSKPDVVFTDASGPAPAGRIFQARVTAGGTDVPLIAGNGIAGQNPGKSASADAVANCTMPVFKFTIEGSKVAADSLLDPLTKATTEKGQTGGIFGPGIGFDLIRVIAKASESTKSGTGEQIAKAMGTLKVPADYSIQYPDGFSYSAESHFPTIKGDTGGKELIPCGSTVENSLWKITE